MLPYPSEETWWPAFEADLARLYADVGRPTPDWAAFRWAARTAYDAVWLDKDQSAQQHLAECHAALHGLPPPIPLTPTGVKNPYPSEETWWPTFEANLAAVYANAGRLEPDWAAFRWAARTAYDASWMDKDASARKHLAECRKALGGPVDPVEPVEPGGVLPELSVRGHVFEGMGGERITLIQCSDFNLLNRYQHGEDITPVLAQRQACGFNALRVWTAYDIIRIGTFLDIDYGRIPAFVGLCARYGCYVEFCAYTGINDPTHWPQLCDAARASTPRPLVELVNELSENTNEPDYAGRVFHLDDYDRPEGLLASHGSNGSEQWPVEPFWDFADFHTNGAFEEQRKIGHNAWEIWPGPTLTNETSRFDDVGMWRGDAAEVLDQLAFDAAAGAALLCAGSCYHSIGGKASDLWDEGQARAASCWGAGARSVRLDYQHGQYRHPIDLETPDVLRAYQRFYNDDRGAETVLIHREPTAITLQRATAELQALPERPRLFLLALFRDYLRYSRSHSPHDDD